MASLTPTARTILGFLASHPRSGYEIRQAASRAISAFWGVSDGQLYPQLRALADAGLIRPMESEDPGRHAKEVWQLTPSGRTALRDWLEAPSAPVTVRDENLVKLLFAAHEDPRLALQLIRERRQHFERFKDVITEAEPGSTWTEEERSKSSPTPALIREYGLDYAETAIAWCDKAERALGGHA
jgi:DNA-binding PadR family transcriptional regulator